MPARRLGAVLLAGCLLAAPACTRGTGDQDASAGAGASSSPSASAAGATASAAPTPSPTTPVKLPMGQPASLRLPTADGERSAVRLAVTKVTKGTIKDLSRFVLDKQTRKSTPYYATVKVTNTGGGDLGGTTVTLWGLDSGGTVRPPAQVIGGFRKCPHKPLPEKFRRGESDRTCLLYLLPPRTTLEAVQYRFDERPPYTWPIP